MTQPGIETAVFSHPACLEHLPPAGYPERVERLRGLLEHAPLAARLQIPTFDAGQTEAAILRVHDARYVERLRAAAVRGDGLIDSADNPLSPGTWDATIGAAASALAALAWVHDGAAGARHAFVAVRPPGHHASRDRAMGFCFVNNVAVAAQALLDRRDLGFERVAIVDFDVHHGNGTQDIFWSRRDVYFVSSHQYPFYPGTGRGEETGAGDGLGATLNVPMRAGADDAAYDKVFSEQIVPALDAWRPQALLVSAGFDAWQRDPLGGMRVTEAGFAAFGRHLRGLAERHCGGRWVSLLEGGYDVEALPRLVEAYLGGVEKAA